jgi:XTP/dITP diphosphohydrolase
VSAGAAKPCVRRAGPDDFEILKSLLREGDAYHRGFGVDGVRQDAVDYAAEDYARVLADPSGAIFIVELAGKAVGFLRATRRSFAQNRLHTERKIVEIDEIVVAEDARGEGFGSALLEAAKAWAKEQPCNFIELNVWAQNEAAIRFYEGRGFVDHRLRLRFSMRSEQPHRPLGGKLVIATHNPGKLREMRELLTPFGIETVSAGELGLGEPDETATSFRENARIKAAAAANAAGLPAFADDSGLCVEALDGAPGIHSARWAGPEKDFQRAMQTIEDLLQARGAVAPTQRRAHFISALCVAWPDGHVEEFEAQVDGTLVWPPRGDAGFGYDPMFLPDGHERTFGEMTSNEKHGLPPRGFGLSHRARAFVKLAEACLERR